MEKLNQIFQELENVKGLKPIAFINKSVKNIVNDLEEVNNHGVFDSLKREYTLLLAHDSSFREPVSKIVNSENGTVTFPGIDFPEVNAKDVVSSSPSLKVHGALIKELDILLDKKEATLLIGFNL